MGYIRDTTRSDMLGISLDWLGQNPEKRSPVGHMNQQTIRESTRKHMRCYVESWDAMAMNDG